MNRPAAILTAIVLLLPLLANGQTSLQRRDGQDIYGNQQQQSLNLSQLPQPPIYNTNKTYNILSTAPDLIQIPTCLAPGFALNFQAYVAQIATLKSYALAQVQAAMQAAPLLLMESLFPEMATIVKHLNNMAWLKLSLQAQSCQQLVNSVRGTSLIGPDTAFATCIAQQQKGDVDLDQAEKNCADRIGKIMDWKGVPQTNIDLVAQAIEMANSDASRNAQNVPPDDKTMKDIQTLYPSVTKSATGQSVVTNVPVLNYYLYLRTLIQNDFDFLIDRCKAQLANTSSCTFDTKTVTPSSTPTLFFPFTAENDRQRTPIINLGIVEPLTWVTSEDRRQILDPVLHRIAIKRLQYLAATGAPMLLASADATRDANARTVALQVIERVGQDIVLVDKQFQVRADLYGEMESLAQQVRTAIANRAAARQAGVLQPVPGATARPFTGRQ